MKITREQFLAYESVRESGVTNMFDTKTVAGLSGLAKDVILEIMKNYVALAKHFLGEVQP